MKLNAEIIYDNLSESWKAELKGNIRKELQLGRPEYFLEAKEGFQDGHFYVLRGEHLPKRTSCGRGALILCIGNSIYLPWYQERCGVIQIREIIDMNRVFNRLTEIFNKYDAWDERLHELLYTDANLMEMIICSQAIFGNPLFVLDADFHYIARSDYAGIELADWERQLSEGAETNGLEPPMLGKFLELQNLSLDERRPIRFNLLGRSTLSVNLFDEKEYIGCLTVDYRRRRHRESDDVLAVHLARLLERALARYAASPQPVRRTLRQIFLDLITDSQLSADQKGIIDRLGGKTCYSCVKIQFTGRLVSIPNGYVCSLVEKIFPKSMAFEHEDAVTAFFDMDALDCGENDFYQRLEEIFVSLVGKENFALGISDPFTEIIDAYLYYLQACSALEHGRLQKPAGQVCLFRDCVLTELIENAMGGMPLQAYFSPGLKRLAEHDAASPVSYLDTLQKYLKHNMSVTRTSAELYLNRSTLLERLGRIKNLLGSELQDPEERLLLQLLLKAMEIRESIHLTAERKSQQ